MKINTNDISGLRNAIDSALLEVGKRYGIKIATGGCRYMPDGSSATFKLELSAIGTDGTVANPDVEFLHKNLAFVGLKPEDLNRTVTIGGKTFKITGYHRRSRSQPYQITEVGTGRGFKTSRVCIMRALGRS